MKKWENPVVEELNISDTAGTHKSGPKLDKYITSTTSGGQDIIEPLTYFASGESTSVR